LVFIVVSFAAMKMQPAAKTVHHRRARRKPMILNT